jgi:ribosomal-protein-alanine N-acetyltransferase
VTLPTIPLGVEGWALRAWRETDAEALARHAGNPAVWRNMSDSFPHPYTLDIASHWVRSGHVEFGGDNWAIAHDDQAVGGCGIVAGDGGLRCNAEIGYWLAESCWGQGIGTRVARTLAERAFADPLITRVFAPVHAYNPASMRVLEHCGFVREGLLQLSALKAGIVIDRVLLARYRPGAKGGMPALPTKAP